MLEGSNRLRAKEPLMVYNSYLRFCCLALLEADSHMLFTIANIGGLANILISSIVDPKDLRWVIPRTCKSM